MVTLQRKPRTTQKEIYCKTHKRAVCTFPEMGIHIHIAAQPARVSATDRYQRGWISCSLRMEDVLKRNKGWSDMCNAGIINRTCLVSGRSFHQLPFSSVIGLCRIKNCNRRK